MTVEQILEFARDLSSAEQKILLESLQNLAVDQGTASINNKYSSLLSLAGSAHSEYQDVSENKLQHLGEAYAAQ
jgi:hypothetical protein